jgi:cytochrome P450
MQFSYWVILNGELIERRLAGSDTTATTLTLMLLQLVNHPTELAILIAEIDAAFPTPESPVTFETTQNLPYLNAVINEGMRCMPLVLGGLPRLVNHPTTINGYEIPPNTLVSTSISNLSWSSIHFPEPKSFVPARWLPKEQQPIPTSLTADKSAFIPFSTGSRSCIGQQ